jgi:hypothetical protein
MPYCVVSHGDPSAAAAAAGEEGDVRIFYQRYGHGGTKVLLIIGTYVPCVHAVVLLPPRFFFFCSLPLFELRLSL